MHGNPPVFMLDFGQIEKQREEARNKPPEYIPEGWYTVTIVGFDVKMNTTRDANQIQLLRWELKCDPPVHEKFRLWLYTIAENDYRLSRLQELLGALMGKAPTSIYMLKPNDWLGKKIRVEVMEITYDGRKMNQIRRIVSA
jgi:hypothetical protein